MNKNVLLPVGLIVPLLNACGGVQSCEQPNILFILVDDLAYDAIENSGRYPFLKTPNINRLQQSGLTFDNYFCTMSLSSPSRACFLTGVYPHIHGVTQNKKKVDADWDNFPPYSQYLQEAGYETAFLGKMHQALLWNKDQVRPGFDYWLGFRGQGDYFHNTLNENGVEFEKDGYITDVLTDYAADWIVNRRDKSKPFSMCLWHKAVHEPFVAAPRHEDCYQDESLPLPPNGNGEDNMNDKPNWIRYKKSHYKISEKDPKWDTGFKMPINILETTLAVDESVGQMLDLLAECGELENTIIIFSSDNGYFMGEHGFWDKRIAYEESMRIPMIISYPKLIEPNTRSSKLCLNIDVAPTLLDVVGIDIPLHMQGRSLLNIMRGKTEEDWRTSFLFEYYVDDEYPYAGPTQVAVRTEDYKLIDCIDPTELDELYDIKNDPGEMVNLINSHSHQIVVKQMYNECERLKKECRYHLDRDFWLRQRAPIWDMTLNKVRPEGFK